MVNSYEEALKALSDGVESIDTDTSAYEGYEKSFATFAAELGRNRTCKHLR